MSLAVIQESAMGRWQLQSALIDMSVFIVRLCAMAVAILLIGQRPGVAAADQDDLRQDPEVMSLLKFVSDATTLDGMFYAYTTFLSP